MPEQCPLCDQPIRYSASKSIYGKAVCKKCWAKFANRRQFAFFIDLVLVRVGQFGGIVVVALVLAAVSPELVQNYGDGIDLIFMLGALALLLAKDGINGQSPGKYLMGIQAVGAGTGVPISFVQSFKRNLILMIPIVPLIVATQVGNGERWGDRWAKTRVVWLKYRTSKVFGFGDAVDSPSAAYAPAIAAGPLPHEKGDDPYRAPLT